MRLPRLLLPVALIALCLMLTDARATLARLSGLSPAWFIATVLLLNAVTILSAHRWRMTAGALNLHLPPGLAVREYYLAQFANQTLPRGPAEIFVPERYKLETIANSADRKEGAAAFREKRPAQFKGR